MFVNQQNWQVEQRNLSNLSLYIHSFCLQTMAIVIGYYTHQQHPGLDTSWLARNILCSSKTHPKTYTTVLFPWLSVWGFFSQRQLYQNDNVLDKDPFSTDGNGTNCQQQREVEAKCKDADIMKWHGCMLRVQGQVIPAFYSHLAMSLRSLPIIVT